ncbi:MAG: carboxypeptidase M32 [Lactobacillaceae bacterium]|jgi:carboxypeptidase Taq|nr:carboxypeptidase M32 [Lactobacillaceae bacterium]
MADEFTGADLRAILREQSILEENLALLSWDQLTGMPKDAGDFRATQQEYITARLLKISTNKHAQAVLAYFNKKKHFATLTDDEQALFIKFKEDTERTLAIPNAKAIAFAKTTSVAQDKWAEARAADDYTIYQPSLEKLIAFKREFIKLWRKDEATPYDVLLGQFEPGMTSAKLDTIFAQVKTGLAQLQTKLREQGTTPDDSFLHRPVIKEYQRDYAMDAAVRLGFNLDKGRLDDTIHPFMQDMNRNDARITTRWSGTKFQMAVLGIFHEAGHALFAQNIDPKWDYTPFNKKISMSIHESQSLFNEVMIGRDAAFWQHDYPVLQNKFNGILDDVSYDAFIAGWMKTQPTLIRTEADPLTYPLHIIIRYEIEKAIFNEDLDLATLPQVWNNKYEEYLGIRPPSDLTGILQDIHWAGGDFGYFPSYALGHLYAAQFRHEMEKTLDVSALLVDGDYQPLIAWLQEHVWQYGASKTPVDILVAATGEELNPQYWLDLQTARYERAYKIN